MRCDEVHNEYAGVYKFAQMKWAGGTGWTEAFGCETMDTGPGEEGRT